MSLTFFELNSFLGSSILDRKSDPKRTAVAAADMLISGLGRLAHTLTVAVLVAC